jgi:hypothetical protein
MREATCPRRHGQLTPRVAATLPMEQVATAHQRVAGGGLRSRIVLTLDG